MTYCTFPMEIKKDVNGELHYVHCGRKAEYKVGMWYLCEGHKKYYADRHKYPAEKIKEAE